MSDVTACELNVRKYTLDLSCFTSVLIARANDYLLRHSDVRVKCLETTRFRVDRPRVGVCVDPRAPTLNTSFSGSGYTVHGLRWVDIHEHLRKSFAFCDVTAI